MRRICGLWKRESKERQSYLGGSITEEVVIPVNSKLLVFGNSYREEDSKKPDYILYYAVDDMNKKDEFLGEASAD